jgi:hypothetical protein
MVLLIDLLADPTAPVTDVLDGDALHDDIRFRSPYADYAGRADVVHLVGLIHRALGELRIDTRLGARLDSGAETMTRFAGRVVTGEEVQGVLTERHDATGRLVEAMLTLRPYSGLRAAMRAMQQLMEGDPLPGSA